MTTFGTDPEFFITSPDGYKSASEIFPIKKEPIVPDRWKDAKFSSPRDQAWGSFRDSTVKLFRDGFGIEINVDPCTCRALLAESLKRAILDVKLLVKEHDPTWDITSKPTVEVPLSYIQKLPDDVKQFGCDPSWNAYEGKEVRISLNGEIHPFRYAGGHLHFGFSTSSPLWKNDEVMKALLHETNNEKYLELLRKLTPDKEKVILLAKLFDLTIGLPLSIIFNEKDEFQRREFYGRAGEFRFQPWGVEYRTPSPRVWNHVILAGMAFGVGRNVMLEFADWEKRWDSLLSKFPSLEKDLQKAINEGDGGKELLQDVKNYYNKGVIDYLAGKGKEVFSLSEMSLHKLEMMPREKGYELFLLEDGRVLLPGKTWRDFGESYKDATPL